MTTSYVVPPMKVEGEGELVGGYGQLDSDFMVIIPEAPLTVNGLLPTSPKQMGFFKDMVITHWKKLYITPLVKFRRSANAKNLYVKDIRTCLPLIYQEISMVRPKRILTMGTKVSKTLIPGFQSMGKDHGSLFTVKGEELDPSLEHLDDTVIVPTFSFADLQTNLMAKPYFQNDLKRFSYTKIIEPEWEVLEHLADIPMPTNGSDITIDVETGGLDLESDMHMVGVGYDDQIFIVWHSQPDDIAQFMTNINNSRSHIVFHNATFDLAHIIRSSGGTAPMPKKRVGDVMVRAHISGIKGKGLKHLTSLHTDLPGPHTGGHFFDEKYLAEDIRSTLALKDVPELNLAKGTYADGLYHDLIPIFVKMRLRGVYMNRDKLLEILVTSEMKLLEATSKLNSYAADREEVNWNSTQQVVEILQSHNIPLEMKTKSGNYSVAEGVLEELQVSMAEQGDRWQGPIEMLNSLLEYRSLSKLVSGFLRSYLDLLDDDGYVYPNLKLLGTATGRLSCADPNLQQVPRLTEIKRCFIPRWGRDHYYGLVDFAGAELRMAAIISGDKQMAEFILSGDPHSHMARIAYPDKIPADATIEEIKEVYAYWRKRSKSTTFAILYGGSIRGIALSNGVPESEVAAVDIALRKSAPRLMNWLDKTKALCVRDLRIQTIFGNHREFTEKFLYEQKGGVERAGPNTVIQGSSGILALIVLRKLHQLCEENNLISRPIFGVHDSILSEIHNTELDIYARLVQEAYLDIENSPIVDYPVYRMLPVDGDLEIGHDWAETESTSPWCDIYRSYPCSSAGVRVR